MLIGSKISFYTFAAKISLMMKIINDRAERNYVNNNNLNK
jgi:hypothetical protein